jgi:hypothetical protein
MLSKIFRKEPVESAVQRLRNTKLKNCNLNDFVDLYIEMVLQEEIIESRKYYRLNKIKLGSVMGQTVMDAGYVYAPYIPITTTPITNEGIQNDVSFRPRNRYTTSGGLR